VAERHFLSAGGLGRLFCLEMGCAITGVAMNALEISGLKKTYQGGVEALKGIDLTVKQGDSSRCSAPTGRASPPPSASSARW